MQILFNKLNSRTGYNFLKEDLQMNKYMKRCAHH